MSKNAKVGSSGFFQMNLCLDIKQNKLIADQWGEMHSWPSISTTLSMTSAMRSWWRAIALALSPFAQKTAELVNSGAFEIAAGSCDVLFRCLAKTCKEHEDWNAGFTGYGDTYTKLAIFT